MSQNQSPSAILAADQAQDQTAKAAADRRPGALEIPLVVGLVTAALGFAWLRRGEGDFTAETGIGYWLGIIGGLMMLVLLVYPLRKRLRALRFLGHIPGWFRIHMVFGIFGPALIVLHSNFSMSSLNSTAAMLSMLIVAGSGFIGRFLYSRIHRGLYGQKQTVRELLGEVEQVKARLCHKDGVPATGLDVGLELTRYQAQRVGGVTGVWGSFARTMTGPFSRAKLRARLIHDIKAQSKSSTPAQDRDMVAAIDRYLLALGRAEAFTFYERSFAAWHLLHLPLFAILVLATVAHIVAVHMY